MIFFPGGYSPGISTAIQDILLQSIRDLGRTEQGDLDKIKNVTGSYQGSVPPGSCRLRIAVRQPLTSKTSAPERRITVSE